MSSVRRELRVALAGGGTAGHIYPALTAIQALQEVSGDTVQALFFGSSRRNEREIVERAGIPFVPVHAGALRGRNPVQAARSLVDIALGVHEARAQLATFKPDVVLATGGYASVPTALAARSCSVPLIVYLPDVHPGWAVRFLACMAAAIAVSTDAAKAKLPEAKTVVTGYPVRREFFTTSREAGRRRLNLEDDLPTLLIVGGSLGAHRINQAVLSGLERLLTIAQVVHISGPADEAWARAEAARLPPELAHRYHLFGYLHDLPSAMLAADLAITRAGASILGELPAAALPAVVVPLDLSDQLLNARYLVARGAAVMCLNEDLERLGETVYALLSDPWRLEEMRTAMQALARPDAAHALARLILDCARTPLARVA